MGQIAVDPADLSSAQAGIIQVNARTLATNNQFRNRAIKNRYRDFELFIPDAQAVDTVEDEVRLELEFVAEATQ